MCDEDITRDPELRLWHRAVSYYYSALTESYFTCLYLQNILILLIMPCKTIRFTTFSNGIKLMFNWLNLTCWFDPSTQRFSRGPLEKRICHCPEMMSCLRHVVMKEGLHILKQHNALSCWRWPLQEERTSIVSNSRLQSFNNAQYVETYITAPPLPAGTERWMDSFSSHQIWAHN